MLKLYRRWANFFDFWRENFGKFVKTAAYGCSGTVWGFFVVRRVIVWAFSVSEQKYLSFGKTISAGLPEIQSTCPKKQFRDVFFGKKNVCSSCLVVERIFSTFGVKALVNVSKLQPMCPAERLKVSFGEKSNCSSVFGLWVKVSIFWQSI